MSLSHLKCLLIALILRTQASLPGFWPPFRLPAFFLRPDFARCLPLLIPVFGRRLILPSRMRLLISSRVIADWTRSFSSGSIQTSTQKACSQPLLALQTHSELSSVLSRSSSAAISLFSSIFSSPVSGGRAFSSSMGGVSVTARPSSFPGFAI